MGLLMLCLQNYQVPDTYERSVNGTSPCSGFAKFVYRNQEDALTSGSPNSAYVVAHFLIGDYIYRLGGRV